jgi:hypothetical protein
MTTTATSTYLAGMTKSGSKIHRVAIVDGATYTGCGSANSALYSRGRQGRIVSTEVVEIDEIPTGALCGSCFPGIISKPRVAAPVAPAAPKAAAPAPVAAEMISYEEAFDMIEAAGHADKVGGRAWILPGQVDRNAILDTIAGWNA